MLILTRYTGIAISGQYAVACGIGDSSAVKFLFFVWGNTHRFLALPLALTLGTPGPRLMKRSITRKIHFLICCRHLRQLWYSVEHFGTSTGEMVKAGHYIDLLRSGYGISISRLGVFSLCCVYNISNGGESWTDHSWGIDDAPAVYVSFISTAAGYVAGGVEPDLFDSVNDSARAIVAKTNDGWLPCGHVKLTRLRWLDLGHSLGRFRRVLHYRYFVRISNHWLDDCRN